jgi:MFS family permease
LLCALALGLINFALIEAAASGLKAPHVFGTLAAGGAALVLFLRVESRAANPLLPLELFRVRTFNAACLMTLAFYSSLYGMLFFLSLNLIQVQQYDAALAGLAQLPLMLLVVLLAPWSGRLADRRGPRLPLVLGAALAVMGFVLLARIGVTAGPADFWRSFFPPLALLGAAMGCLLAPLSAMVVASAPVERAGLSSAITAALSRLSSVLGIAILGPIVLLAFEHSLEVQAARLKLRPEARQFLTDEAPKLAEAQPPPNLPSSLHNATRDAIRLAYVRAFHEISLLCAAAVAFAAALALALTRGYSVYRL